MSLGGGESSASTVSVGTTVVSFEGGSASGVELSFGGLKMTSFSLNSALSLAELISMPVCSSVLSESPHAITSIKAMDPANLVSEFVIVRLQFMVPKHVANH